ncbi:hypothetical protein [Kitasatospora sp. MMS16-BH015]|nr:hypothetical protein [Kitasatospora sp. MMS16-BH015]
MRSVLTQLWGDFGTLQLSEMENYDEGITHVNEDVKTLNSFCVPPG